MAPRNPFEFNRRIERQYERTLRQAAKVIADLVRGYNTPGAATNALSKMSEAPSFQVWANRQAVKMARSVLVNNAKTWREAVKKGTNAQKIYGMLSKDFMNRPEYWAMIEKNANWIKTMPTSTAQEITKIAAREALAGRRTAEIMAEIKKKTPDLAGYRARRIARTEVAKANALITEMRSQEAGVGWYIWRTVNDQRVRSSHDLMEGVLCRYNQPPCPEQLAGIKGQHSFYNPGSIFNCRCFSSPVILLEEIQWPAKVHINGRIQRMNRREFERISG